VKPVALVADAILDCTARGDLVLDAFLGSGTTALAAERVGRRCYAR
jgi:DNA modification methylase